MDASAAAARAKENMSTEASDASWRARILQTDGRVTGKALQAWAAHTFSVLGGKILAGDLAAARSEAWPLDVDPTFLLACEHIQLSPLATRWTDKHGPSGANDGAHWPGDLHDLVLSSVTLEKREPFLGKTIFGGAATKKKRKRVLNN